MNAHTPGPWRADRRAILATDPVMGLVQIAEVFSGAADSLAQADANQRLIAAAPDLLEALQNIVDEANIFPSCKPFMRFSLNSYLPPHLINAAIRAIDKAEGES